MDMKKYIFALLLVTSYLFLASPARADEEVRSLLLDLTAKGYSQSVWQDNLNSSDIIFAPGDKFQLKLKISNEGNRNQTQLKVRQTLPSSVTSDVPAEFTIDQIVGGENYTKDIVITVRDKAFVYKALTNNSLRFTVRSEIGTEASDYLAFSTSNGTKEIVDNTPVLPNTGSAATMVFGSAISAALAFAGLRLRQYVRGY